MKDKQIQRIAKDVRAAADRKRRLEQSQFDLQPNTTGSLTEVARVQAPEHLILRNDVPLRMMFPHLAEFTTNGTAGDTETFSFSTDIVQTPNTENFVLYEAGSEVSPDSVDYTNDAFDYTDDGTNNNLDAYAISREPGRVVIKKEAPGDQQKVEDTVYDNATSLIHEQDQHQDPETFDIDQSRPLHGVVPYKWDLVVYVDAPYQVGWAGDQSGFSGESTTALNALLNMPVLYTGMSDAEVARAVKQDIVSQI